MPPSLKDQLKAALTNIHERALDYPQWGLTGVLIREFTARERQYANDAVQQEGPTDPDQILFRAMLLQRCITDPDTGRPYSDGRMGADGQAAIDPRTRTPVFTVADITDLADSRAIVFNRIWDDLLDLAAAGPLAMFSRGGADERGERDARADTPGDGAPAGGAADQGPGDVDGGGEVLSGPEPAAGDTDGHAA